jgi:GNAT superfamily N-acetyltransferase
LWEYAAKAFNPDTYAKIMRGLKLFVRFADATDRSAVTTFLRSQLSGSPQFHGLTGSTDDPPSFAPGVESSASTLSFLIGKLLGDLVAVLGFDLEGDDALRVDCIVVADDFRRKRIGRAMLNELESTAAKLERPKIVINEAGDAAEFLRRVGFQSEGERWVKFVTTQSQSS